MSGRPSGAVAGLAGLIAIVVAAAVVVVVAGGPSPAHRTARSTSRAAATAAAARDAALRSVVYRFGRAVVHHDRRLLLSTLDPRAGRFRAAALSWLADARAVPFATWRLMLGPVAGVRATGGRAIGGTAAVQADGSQVRYRVAGFDTRAVVQPVRPLFVERAGRWGIAALAGRPDGMPRPTELWDLEPVQAVHAAGVLVVGGADQLATMREVSALAAAAIPRITQVWGGRWPQRAVLEVPDSQRQFGRISGYSGPLRAIAAVTDSEIHGFGPADPAGDRIAINPSAWARLSPAGRQIVITHEMTHVATRASTAATTPKWLSEGFAEWLGFRDSGVPVAVAAIALGREVAAGRLPRRLPPDAEFSGSPTRLDLAYDEAWLACATIADRWGSPALVRFYRAVGASRRPPQNALADGLRRVLHTSMPGLIQHWRRRLSATLG